MRAKLSCVGCGALLSAAIEIPDQAADPEDAGIVFVDQRPLTSVGAGFLSSRPMQWSEDEEHKPALQFSPQYWLNPRDLESAVEPVDDANRLNGCCGPDGCDGPNMRCRSCKAEVGTRQNDCWTSDVFIPEPSATKWLEIGT